MIYFDSDMSKSTITVVYFDWKTVIYIYVCGKFRNVATFIWIAHFFSNVYFNITSFFRFVNKRASYPFGIISFAHAPVNVTDLSIGSMLEVLTWIGGY
jgi:hypothetical protein